MTAVLEPKLKKAKKIDFDVAAFNAARREEVLESIDAMVTAREAWAESEEQDPSPEFCSAIAEAIHIFGYLPLPSEFATYVNAMERVAVGLAGICGHEDYRGKGIPFADLDTLAAIRSNFERDARPRKLETLADLKDQGLSPMQAAKIHGLTVDEVRREWETPGSVCGEGYVPPVLRQEQESQSKAHTWCGGMALSQLSHVIRSLLSDHLRQVGA